MTSGNRLLDALPEAEYRCLRPALEVVTLASGSLSSVGERWTEYVYFPSGSLLVKCVQERSGASPQVSMLGRSGLLGLTAFLGAQQPVFAARTAIPGRAVRIRLGAFRDAADHSSALRELLERHTLALVYQIGRTSVCNARCHASERVACWLLRASDEVGSDRLAVTHDLVAQLLGLRRATVTDSLHPLEARGVLRPDRGRVVIVDRPGLEATACDCYRDVRDHYRQLFPEDDRRSGVHRSVRSSELPRLHIARTA
jgi:CRP-like cAMP-binding protein